MSSKIQNMNALESRIRRNHFRIISTLFFYFLLLKCLAKCLIDHMSNFFQIDIVIIIIPIIPWVEIF